MPYIQALTKMAPPVSYPHPDVPVPASPRDSQKVTLSKLGNPLGP